MPAPTNQDWGNIYAMAWKDPKFKYLLETNPVQAIAEYGKTVGKTFDAIVDPAALSPPANLNQVPEEFWPLLHQAPPACC
jgi:hypothetical protein